VHAMPSSGITSPFDWEPQVASGNELIRERGYPWLEFYH